MDRLALSFIFGAGIVVQTLLFLLSSSAENRLPRIAAAASAGLFGLMPGKHERDYQLHFHVCYCFIIYAFMIFALFKKEIMAKVSESSLLGNSLVFWYACVTFFDGSDPQRTVMAAAILPTLATLVIAFTVRVWSFQVRLCCYVWFLALMLAISCFQIRFGNMSFVWTSSYDPPGPFSLFLTGMAFSYLIGSLFYIYILIPLNHKHQTSEQRMVIWRQDAHLMASCFADYQMTAPQALTIIVCQGGLYFVNHLRHLVSATVMMNVSLLALPYVFDFLFRFYASSVSTDPRPDSIR